MTDTEFRKIWNLLYDLWPEIASKRNAAVWRIGLAPYPMDAIKGRVLQYARQNKYFPDLADITAGLVLPPPAANGEAEREALYGMNDLERMERLLAKLQAK